WTDDTVELLQDSAIDGDSIELVRYQRHDQQRDGTAALRAYGLPATFEALESDLGGACAGHLEAPAGRLDPAFCHGIGLPRQHSPRGMRDGPKACDSRDMTSLVEVRNGNDADAQAEVEHVFGQSASAAQCSFRRFAA